MWRWGHKTFFFYFHATFFSLSLLLHSYLLLASRVSNLFPNSNERGFLIFWSIEDVSKVINDRSITNWARIIPSVSAKSYTLYSKLPKIKYICCLVMQRFSQSNSSESSWVDGKRKIKMVLGMKMISKLCSDRLSLINSFDWTLQKLWKWNRKEMN